MAAVKALQQWCKIQCDGYRDVTITNMTTSFRDGMAFCALIHKHRPDLIDYDALSKENVYENNNLAFHVAEDQLGIPALLDAEDMVALKVPDRLSILTYVSQYYNYFHGRSPIGGMGGIKRPAESSTEEPSGKKNLPVTAKTFPAKPATGTQKPTIAVTPPSKASPKQTRAANERKVLVESSNRTGTLSSKCAACKQHVHLVQRHLVDGKLYHRNCFKCTECSNILLSGTYKPGSVPGTFICTTHQNAPSSGLAHKNGPPRIGPTWLVNKNDRTETPRPASALSTSAHASPKPSTLTPTWLVNKNDRTEPPRPSGLSTPVNTNTSSSPKPSTKASSLLVNRNDPTETSQPTHTFLTPVNANVTPKPSTPALSLLANKNDRPETPRSTSALSTPVIPNASPKPSTPASSLLANKNDRTETPHFTSALSTSVNANASPKPSTKASSLLANKNDRTKTPHPTPTLSTPVNTNATSTPSAPAFSFLVTKNDQSETPRSTSALSTPVNNSANTSPKPSTKASSLLANKNDRTESPHSTSVLSTLVIPNASPKPSTPAISSLADKNDRTETPCSTSALSTPVDTKPSTPASTSKYSSSITAKTQEARSKFFETTPTAPADPPPNRWAPTTNQSTGRGGVLLRTEDQKDKAKALITKKLTEGNSNNNNTTYQSGLKPTSRKFGNKLSPSEFPSWTKDQDGSGVKRLKPVEPSLPQNATKSTTGPSWVKSTDKESPRPPSTFSSNIKDSNISEAPSDWRAKLKPVSKHPTVAESKEPPFSAETKRAEAPPKPSSGGLRPPPARPSAPPAGAHLAVPAGQRAPSPQPSRNGATAWGFQNGKGSSSANASQPEVKSPKPGKPDFIPKEEIMKELQDIENSLNELEKKGIELEKQLRRSEEDGEEDTSMDEVMVDWFNLIRSKQIYMRRESELVYIAKTQDLEEQQPGVEEQLRRLLEKPDHLKTSADKRREEELMKKLLEIVDDRNAIVEGLDEDRLREEEEDQQMNQLMLDLDMKKNKKKSPMKKLFGWKS